MTDRLNWRPIIPMGAVREDNKIQEYLKNPSYIGQIKKDGIRMLLWIGNGKGRLTTRSVNKESFKAGNPWPNERTDCIPHLRDIKYGDKFEGTILDGEIWKPGCTSHDMTSMVGGLPETSIANQEREGKVHYHIYDILQYCGEDVTQVPLWKRQALLINVAEEIVEMNPHLDEYISVAENFKGEDIMIQFAKEIAEGREGMVLKHLQSKYYLGKIKDGKGEPAKVKASKSKGIPDTPWVKIKKFDTYDCVITGFSPAEEDYTGKYPENHRYWQDELGNKYQYPGFRAAQINIPTSVFKPITKFHFYGWPGAIKFGQYKDGELVEVGQTSGITDEWRQKFAESPEDYIGEVIEVGAFERIKKTGALREPRFIRIRDDKSAFECIMED